MEISTFPYRVTICFASLQRSREVSCVYINIKLFIIRQSYSNNVVVEASRLAWSNCIDAECDTQSIQVEFDVQRVLVADKLYASVFTVRPGCKKKKKHLQRPQNLVFLLREQVKALKTTIH